MFIITPSDIVFSQATITPHSPLLNGTFTITIDGTPVGLQNGSSYNNYNIPYNVNQYQLAAAFQNLVGYEKTQVIESCPIAP
jgi:hypothetical protein